MIPVTTTAKVLGALSAVLMASSGDGFFSAEVCLTFPLLLGLTLLPAEAVTAWLTDMVGITSRNNGGDDS